MTRDELPPQAISIKDAVTRATCSAATVQALEHILREDGRRAPVSKKEPVNVKHPEMEEKRVRAKKGARNKLEERPSVAVLDENEAAVPELSIREKFRLATDVVNNILKILTAVIQSRSKQHANSVKRLSSSASDQPCTRTSAVEIHTPLRTLSINRTSNTPNQNFQSPRLLSATSNENATALLATAKCGSVAFAIMRSVGAQKIAGIETPYLRLENGMSAFIGKLLALGFNDMATQEVQVLRRRLDRFKCAPVQSNGDAPNVKIPITIAKSGSTKELLPDLLVFQNINARGPLLNLIITTQFQTLKIIAASSSARTVEGAVKNLDLNNPSSPVVLIEQQIDQNSPQTCSKAAQQLASLSNLLLQICASFETGEQAQVSEPKRNICPSTAFRYQVLALEIRLKWWKIAGHEGDALNGILKPFEKCLSSFQRRSKMSEEAKCRHCRGHAERLLMQLNAHQKGASTVVRSVLQAISGLQLTLADLARESSDFQIAQMWMTESERSFDLSNASESHRYAFLCQRATLRIRAHPELGGEQQILDDMLDLSMRLDQNLEDLDDIAEIIIVLNGHRKSILALVRNHHQSPSFSSSGFAIQCSRFFCCGMKIISTFINRLEMHRNEREKAAISLSKWQLIWDVANPFIESIAMLARSSMACSVEDWKTIDAGLQYSIRLARKLNGTDRIKTHSAHESYAATSCLVSISNSYWCRFLHIKQHLADNVEKQKLLAASIDAVRGQPISLQNDALLPAKLEKQASLYEVSKDYHQAAKAYAQIITILIGNGCVSSAAEVATTRSLQVVFQETGAIGLLGRSLVGYQRAMSYGNAEAPESRLSFNPQKLSTSENGLVLEYQLTAISSKVISHGYTTVDSQLIQELVSALFSIYTHDDYPIRRLRVYIRLVHLRLHNSSIISTKVQEQLSREQAGDGVYSSLGKDSDLEPYIAHLYASRDVCSMLSSRNVDTEGLDRLLAVWFNVLQGCVDQRTLQTRVDDIADWLLQLEALKQHLEIQGHDYQRVTVLQLMIKIREMTLPLQLPDLISELNALGVQYARLGYSGHAGMILQRAQKHVSTATPSWPSTVRWHLAYAEYLLSIGSSEKSESHLSIAQDLFKSLDHHRLRRHEAIQLVSDAASLYARLSVARGDYSRALFFCRLRVKLLQYIWSRSEKRCSDLINHKTSCNLGDKMEELADTISSLTITKSPSISARSKKATQNQDSETCALIPQLFEALTSLAELYAHEGFLAESQYYMEQSAKVANNALGTSFKNRYHVQLGQYLVRGNAVEDAVCHLEKAEATCNAAEPNINLVSFYIALAEKYVKLDDLTSAMSTLLFADSTLKELLQTQFIDRLGVKRWDVAVPGEHDLPLTEALAPVKSNTRARGRAKLVAGRHEASTAHSSFSTAANTRSHGSVALKQERGRILQRQAFIALCEGNLDRAEHLINDADVQSFRLLDRITKTMSSATLATRRALAKMANDLVFCVIPESTMCCPSTAPTSNNRDISPDDCQAKTIDQAAGPRGETSKLIAKVTKQPQTSAVPDFVELLHQAQEHFDKIRPLTISAGSTADLHSLVDGLMRNLVMLSAFPSHVAAHLHSPFFAMYVMELGRNVAVVRQRQALRVERQLSLAPMAAYWPAQNLEDTALFNELVSDDLASFQSKYLDIIPKSWKVVSLTLSESHDEIRVAKFRSCHSPFILNLPLGRHAQDGDGEPFGFEQGRDELRDIIKLANYSTHDAPDTSLKGAKTQWWDTRAALDARLKDLLANIESIWFGGFRGILGQDFGTPDLLLRFQQSLHGILDKYLPSRQKQTKTKRQNRHLLLDSHVLELFVAVGNPNERDLDEELLDLVYFVIDILQFHGERNAYDEVDFDAITVELLDALRQYHEAAKNQANAATSQHTILILDKALHCFPWESLPCMKGQAVSRLPSLGCLRDRILQQSRYHQPGTPTSTNSTLSLSPHSGAYVLNPSGDLTATQSKFEESLEKLTDWDAVVNREPGEDELKMALESKDILLYFGHGSGSQYIRPRTIRKLDRCAVALLMGCSSGALAEAGEYESYGTPINYMQAGCPAVLATLWDVTDKDIDRFSQTVLEKWGLFEMAQHNVSDGHVKKGAKSRGKSKARMAESEDTKRKSLDQAVADGRDSCIMRYLNGAAPVIYGVPVMLS